MKMHLSTAIPKIQKHSIENAAIVKLATVLQTMLQVGNSSAVSESPKYVTPETKTTNHSGIRQGEQNFISQKITLKFTQIRQSAEGNGHVTKSQG